MSARFDLASKNIFFVMGEPCQLFNHFKSSFIRPISCSTLCYNSFWDILRIRFFLYSLGFCRLIQIHSRHILFQIILDIDHEPFFLALYFFITPSTFSRHFARCFFHGTFLSQFHSLRCIIRHHYGK